MAVADKHQVGRAGEHFVAAELHRRGAYVALFVGNMPDIDIQASNTSRTRTVSIQVKTRTKGSWHSDIRKGDRMDENPADETFWIFVDLKKVPEPPEYYIVRDSWMRNNIYERHQEILRSHGGTRLNNPKSTHHAINLNRIEQWKGRWDLLGIGVEEESARGAAV